MRNTERKKQNLQSFLNDLWDACASGEPFNITKARQTHGVSSPYCAYITRHVVKKSTHNPRTFVVNPGWNKEWLANKLSGFSIDAMNKVLEAAEEKGADPRNLIRYVSAGDVVTSPYRFETATSEIETETKDEADRTIRLAHAIPATDVKVIKESIEKSGDIPVELNRNVVLTMNITRTINGVQRDAVTFEVDPNISYENLKSSLIETYKISK